MMMQHRHGWLVAIIIAIAGTTARGESLDTNTLRLWPTAVIGGDAVTLGDIADLSACETTVRERLANLVVRTAPTPGGEVLVSVADLRTALVATDRNWAALQIVGAAKCRIARPRPVREPRPAAKATTGSSAVRATELSSEDPAFASRSREINSTSIPTGSSVTAGTLESCLRDFIVARSEDPLARLDIRFSLPHAALLKLRASEHEFQIRPTSDKRLGLLSYEVDIRTVGEPVRTEGVLAEVQLVKEVVVARRPINRGETIEPRSLMLEERRFAEAGSVGLTSLASAVGQQCGTFVGQGEMLRPETLKAKPLVQRGDVVTIWARLGGVEVKTIGRAQSAGAMGETIAVCRDGSRRKQDLIDAVVCGPKTVTVSDGQKLVSR